MLLNSINIFLTVGVWCRKLEVANIVSRIKQENFHTYAGPGERQNNLPLLNNQIPGEANEDQAADAQENNEQVQPVEANAIHYFPGITLRFCVSDIGLQALERGCKLLRRITMNKISNHSPAQVTKILVICISQFLQYGV